MKIHFYFVQNEIFKRFDKKKKKNLLTIRLKIAEYVKSVFYTQGLFRNRLAEEIINRNRIRPFHLYLIRVAKCVRLFKNVFSLRFRSTEHTRRDY